MEVLSYILGAKVESMTTYLLDENGISLTEPEYYFEIVRPNPGYVEVEYDESNSFIDGMTIGSY